MARRLLSYMVPLIKTGSYHTSDKIQLSTKRNISLPSPSTTFCALRYLSSFRRRAPLSHKSVFCPQDINSEFQGHLTSRTIHQSQQSYHPAPKEVRARLASHKSKKKPSKSSVKEFTIKGKTGDHDMSIKLAKIQGLLEKGKLIEIFIKYDSSTQDKNAFVTGIQKKLEENLQGTMAKLRLDFSNQHTTKVTISPVVKTESGTTPTPSKDKESGS